MSKEVSGNLRVARDVLADIAGHAALECYGVVDMASQSAVDGLARLRPSNKLRRGVKVTTTETGVKVDLFVVMEYGTNISAVSENLKDAVRFALESTTEIPIDGIDVHVRGVKVRR